MTIVVRCSRCGGEIMVIECKNIVKRYNKKGRWTSKRVATVCYLTMYDGTKYIPGENACLGVLELMVAKLPKTCPFCGKPIKIFERLRIKVPK